jgi:hypothetical protein
MITAQSMNSDGLERQCRLFSRYLLDREPTAYVLSQYLRAHQVHPEFVNARLKPFDEALLRLGPGSRLTMPMVDAYARIFAPRSMLRKKLILLLAILESSPGSFESLESPTATSRVGAYISLAARCARFAGFLALSSMVLLPVQLVLLAVPGRRHG